MFPFDIEDDDINIVVEEEKEPTDYEIDFTTGKLTGRVISGLDAIVQKVRLILSTDRYYFTQYSWDHGCELSTLIGKSLSQEFVDSEVKRMIVDALSVDKDILGIDNLKCKIEKDKLIASFRLKTIYGEEEINV